MKFIKDTSVIPKGDYCYSLNENKERQLCPYYRIIPDRPEQYNGWCDFLEKGDIEIAEDWILYDEKSGEKILANDIPIPLSLLWDQCKECGINND